MLTSPFNEKHRNLATHWSVTDCLEPCIKYLVLVVGPLRDKKCYCVFVQWFWLVVLLFEESDDYSKRLCGSAHLSGRISSSEEDAHAAQDSVQIFLPRVVPRNLASFYTSLEERNFSARFKYGLLGTLFNPSVATVGNRSTDESIARYTSATRLL